MVELVEWKLEMAVELKELMPTAAAGFAVDKWRKAVLEAEQNSSEMPEERTVG
jgi:hypothetical protein